MAKAVARTIEETIDQPGNLCFLALPEPLYKQLVEVAFKRGITFAELTRLAFEAVLKEK